MGQNVNKQSRICGPHNFTKIIISVIYLHAFLAVSYIDGSMFHCLNMFKMYDLNNSDL